MSMVTDYIDMDTQEKIRCFSESSNASTSGYSTMSPGGGLVGGGNTSPSSSVYSLPSPGQAPSPASALQTEFSNLILPASSPQQQRQYSPHLPSAPTTMVCINSNYINFPVNSAQPQHIVGLPTKMITANRNAIVRPVKAEFPAELRILEQPVEKFRFRYKSEMHGTHGSLNGANSKRTPKTFPEVELVNFSGRAIIRCSLFQTNLESPHSHQLVVRKDEMDICDPHDLEVSPERGYVAQFQNMGIIHTAKKFIFEELLKKKRNRLEFEMGTDELSTKQVQELHRQTEKEAKDMNLNQVRLCFEAFKVDSNNCWARIAAPVYTNSINNRKSAQTGELRICRLSIATGNVAGGDDLILLVEKVSKKNIKVRFYETNEDDETIWEAFGRFRESDVHHQYAIVCQTPAYKDKEIDKPVEVCVELVRPSDDERSFPPVTFRYKPRDTVASRKRRRTGSSTTSSSGSASSFSSVELPKTVQEQTANMGVGVPINPFSKQQQANMQRGPTISEEFFDFREQELQKLTGDTLFRDLVSRSSEELTKIVPMNFSTELNFENIFSTDGAQPQGHLEPDGAASQSSWRTQGAMNVEKKRILEKTLMTAVDSKNAQLQKIFRVFDLATKNATPIKLEVAAKEVSELFLEHADKNEMGDSLLHEIISNDNPKLAIKTCHILNTLKLNDLLNRVVNSLGESGLHCACLHDRPHYIRPLLGLGCDPNIQDRRGNTALHVAVKEQRQKCIESFLNMDNIHIDLTTRNDEGLTPLHLAIRLNSSEAAKRLLKYDKSSALVRNTKEGNNALHMAVQQQNLELVKYILELHDKGSILAAKNAAGLTCLEVAEKLKSKANQPMLNYLMEEYKNVDIKFTVKTEDSSSTDDDDSVQMLSMADVEVKEEALDDDDMASDQQERHILLALNNSDKFQKVATLLDKADKWKLVAKKSNLQRYACLWDNASAMLNHIKDNATAVDCEAFEKVLSEVDNEAFETLQT